jgi:hypothetical protein
VAFIAIEFINPVSANEWFKNFPINEKIQISSNISANCTIHFKQQTTKLSNQYIQKLCSCVGMQMADLLVPFDIIEEQQKNPNRVIDNTTSFRKI